jgi:hypothetical protein
MPIELQNEGSLTSLGYHLKNGKAKRRKALRTAVAKFGRVRTLRKLVAVRNLTRRKHPDLGYRYTEDIGFLQKNRF